MNIVLRHTLIFSAMASLATIASVAIGILFDLEGFSHLGNFASFVFFAFGTFLVYLAPAFMGISILEKLRKHKSFRFITILMSILFGLGSKFIYFNLNIIHLKRIQFPFTEKAIVLHYLPLIAVLIIYNIFFAPKIQRID